MTWAIIAIGFLVPVAAGLLTRFQPMIAGFLWPVVVALLTAIYVFAIEPRGIGEEPQKIAITFYALFSLVGGVPGGLVGWILQYKRTDRETRNTVCPSLFSREGGSPVWIPAFAGKQGFRRNADD